MRRTRDKRWYFFALTVFPQPFGPVTSVTGELPKSRTWWSVGEKDRTPMIISFWMEDMLQ